MLPSVPASPPVPLVIRILCHVRVTHAGRRPSGPDRLRSSRTRISKGLPRAIAAIRSRNATIGDARLRPLVPQQMEVCVALSAMSEETQSVSVVTGKQVVRLLSDVALCASAGDDVEGVPDVEAFGRGRQASRGRVAGGARLTGTKDSTGELDNGLELGLEHVKVAAVGSLYCAGQVVGLENTALGEVLSAHRWHGTCEEVGEGQFPSLQPLVVLGSFVANADGAGTAA